MFTYNVVAIDPLTFMMRTMLYDLPGCTKQVPWLSPWTWSTSSKFIDSLWKRKNMVLWLDLWGRQMIMNRFYLKKITCFFFIVGFLQCKSKKNEKRTKYISRISMIICTIVTYTKDEVTHPMMCSGISEIGFCLW